MKIDTIRQVTYNELVGQGGALAGLAPDNATSGTGAHELVKVSSPPKVWRGLISQTSTAAPTATVLENTLGGTIALARTSAGLYTLILTGAFTSGKTFMHLQAAFDIALFASIVWTDANTLTITTKNATVVADALLTLAALEILVYQ